MCEAELGTPRIKTEEFVPYDKEVPEIVHTPLSKDKLKQLLYLILEVCKDLPQDRDDEPD